MKAPDFAYARPGTLPEAFDLLAGGEGVKLLAGGQSLLAALNMRLSAPTVLVDLNRIPDLSGVAVNGRVLRIGAMTRHCDIAASDEIAAHAPLLAMAVPHIAHPAIRNRGTIGGSLALADPAAEYPACCLGLEATLVAVSKDGERRIAARDFFRGIYETALEPHEILIAIEIPLPVAGASAGFDELSRRHGDYAMVGLAAQGVRDGASWRDLRLAFFGVGDRPTLALEAAATMVHGRGLAAAQAALADDLSPPDDGECSAATRMQLARVLLGRVLARMEQGSVA